MMVIWTYDLILLNATLPEGGMFNELEIKGNQRSSLTKIRNKNQKIISFSYLYFLTIKKGLVG